MKDQQLNRLALICVLVLGVSASVPAQRQAPVSGDLPRVESEHVVYEGAFRLPVGSTDQTSFTYGGTAAAYNAERNSLLLVGHDWHQRVAEVSIPTPVRDDIPALPRATLIQPFTDVLAGRERDKIGGLLPWLGRLIVSNYIYYDAAGSQRTSHFVTRLNFPDINSSTVTGPVSVGTPAQTGFVSGYMTRIPNEWQAALGGPALTGNCCLSIISRTSLGPSVSVFDPVDVGVKNPVPATRVLGYPPDHPTIGENTSAGALFNATAQVKSVVFPAGTSSVLFFGTIGTGPICYKDDGPSGCHGTTGYYAPPYVAKVWAYDANDLVAVKNGRRNPWDVLPYATWNLTLTHQIDNGVSSVAYDPATQRLFVVAYAAEVNPRQPIIEVFKIQGIQDSTTPAPRRAIPRAQ